MPPNPADAVGAHGSGMDVSSTIVADPVDPRVRGRRGFRLRVHIATLFVALIAAAGLAIVGYGYVATSRLLLSAGDEEFRHLADRTADRVRDLLAPARLLVQLLARHRLTEAETVSARLEALPLLTAALADHPEISAIYAGYPNGDFFLVRTLHDAARQSLGAPPNAVFLVQSRVVADGPRGGRYLFLDAHLAVLRDDLQPDYRFDPRTRGWYREALLTTAPVRTNPYMFFTTREIGTTLAQQAPDGRCVVAADITLRDLSRHLARFRLVPSARMALVDPRGTLVAHPDADRLFRSGPDAPRLGDLADAALEPLFSAAGDVTAGTSLELGGRAWIGMRRSIAPDAGDPLILLVAAPRDELVAEAAGLARRQVLIGIGVIVLALGLVWFSARLIARPLETLSRSVEKMGRGDLDTPLPEIGNPVEVADLADVTDRMRAQLKDHIEQRASRLADERRRARELEIARQIQQSMLPAPLHGPLGGRYLVAAALVPAREVGGDLYDFFLQDAHRLAFVMGDVADKGVPAALLMARVTGLFRALGQGGNRPDRTLGELDARLCEGNDACMFVTAVCAQLDGDTGNLCYASAGHEPPLVRKVDGTTVSLAAESGSALGLDANNAFPLWSHDLAPGDAVVLYTDGATEAFDASGAAFGLERLCQVVADTPLDALSELPGRLLEAVERFSVGGGPRDDLAILAVQYRPPDVEVGASGAEWWRLSLSSAPEDLVRAQRRIEAILRARDVPASTVHDCALAAEEVLANIAMHAYGGDGAGETRLEVRLFPAEIQLRFEDAGPPFDPLSRPDPDLDAPLAERAVGGHGIALVKQLVDRCEYARVGHTNVFTLSRARPVEPAGPAPAIEDATQGGVMALEITITSPKPAERRVALRGRLDTLTAPQLDEKMAPVLDATEVTALIFQLEGLDYISSAGIRCMIRAGKAIGARGGRVSIVNPQAGVRRVFEIVKALPAENVFASEAELDAYLDTMQRKASGHP
ncbi:MAG TPA: anti-sigma factor antagonist [Candidatus Methylomirabilis sp.]|nr:anti-sigma factor antagonist [Candidatus Methylomirabilis sp.]